MKTELTERQRKQNLFDATWQTAKEMKEPCMTITGEDDDVSCVYQRDDGAHCFIGARLRPNSYQPNMDSFSPSGGISASGLLDEFKYVEEEFLEDGFSTDRGFLEELQQVHDKHFDERFEKLRDVADVYQLVVPANEN